MQFLEIAFKLKLGVANFTNETSGERVREKETNSPFTFGSFDGETKVI